MKGVIVCCLAELIETKFGKEEWQNALENAGLPRTARFLVTQNIRDGAALKVIQSVCAELGLPLEQAANAFGEYWMNEYAPKIYETYYYGVDSAREFLLKMDAVHKRVTQSMPNAHPPRFDYAWKNEKVLVMTYKSQRGLIDFLVGLVRGVGKYFEEELEVKKTSDTTVEILFP